MFSYKLAIMRGNSKAITLTRNVNPHHELSTVCQGKFIHRTTELIDMVSNSNSPAPKRASVRYQTSPSHLDVAIPSSPSRLGSLMLTDGHSESPLVAKDHVRRWIGKNLGKPRRRTSLCFLQHLESTVYCCIIGRVTINILPDDALLEMFNFYLGEDPGIDELEEWHILVHVCRKWRIVVLGSPRRLNLQLHCGTRKPVRQMLGVWPVLPIIIWDWKPTRAVDNIIAALGHNDRVCQIELGGVPSLLLEKVLAAMQEPFLALTSLQLWTKDDDVAPVISDSFLGASAPHLQYLDFNCLPYLGLPKLLASATHLVTLHLLDIPHSGYISPKAMITALSPFIKPGNI